jgi:hypothetical protein
MGKFRSHTVMGCLVLVSWLLLNQCQIVQPRFDIGRAVLFVAQISGYIDGKQIGLGLDEQIGRILIDFLVGKRRYLARV